MVQIRESLITWRIRRWEWHGRRVLVVVSRPESPCEGGTPFVVPVTFLERAFQLMKDRREFQIIDGFRQSPNGKSAQQRAFSL